MQWEGNWYDTEDWPKNQYRYNGKELNSDFGLDWYAYGARWYEPAVGRFTGVDPISDRFPWVSTYNYAENKVPNAIDLHGLQAIEVNKNNNTVNITTNIVYNQNNRHSNYYFTATGYSGQTLAQVAKSNGFSSQTFTTTHNNQTWTTNFSVNYVPVGTDNDIINTVLNDQSGASVGFVVEASGKAGYYSAASRTISIGAPQGDGTTINHELGHFIGLPHSSLIPGSPYYGQGTGTNAGERLLGDTRPDAAKVPGPIMSYDGNRKIQNYEVDFITTQAVNLANQQNANIINLTNYYAGSQTSGLMLQSNYANLIQHYGNRIRQAFNNLNIKQ